MQIYVCFSDISTGVIHTAMFAGKNAGEMVINELARFMPAEILYNSSVSKADKLLLRIVFRSQPFAVTLQ